MYIGLHGKYPLFLSIFDDTSIVLTDFRKIFKYQISSETVQLFHAGGLTDMMKLIFALRNFVNAPKNMIFGHNLFF